jgi:hypothetical protein
MPYARYSPKDVVARGEAIYQQEIRHQVDLGNNKGKFVVIDIETGDYEIDPDDLQATTRLLAKRPEAVLYGVRVGYPTAYTLGGHRAAEAL